MTDRITADTTSPQIGFFRGPLQKYGSAPTTVQFAFWLLIAGAAATVAEIVVLVGIDWITYGSVRGALLAALVLGALSAALRVYVCLAILRGYAPARIYLGVIGVLVLFSGFAGGIDLLSALIVGTIAAAIVLVWLPASSRYFSAVTAARTGNPPQKLN